MTFLVDANVLIDLGHVQGLEVLPKLGNSEVLDVVLEECQDPDGLADQVVDAEIQAIETSIAWQQKANRYKNSRLSSQDVLNFYYAQTYQRTLLTNEKPLRNLCEREGVSYHGLLWIVEQAYRLQLESSESLCNWLLTLEHLGSRFPDKELADLRQLLQCSDKQPKIEDI